MTEDTPPQTDIETLLAAIDERDAEIARLKERIRVLEFTAEHAAERIKHRAHATVNIDPLDKTPRGNMGQRILTHEEGYAVIRALWPSPVAKAKLKGR